MRIPATVLFALAAPGALVLTVPDAHAQGTASQIAVAEAQVAAAIEDRQPMGVAESFPSDVGQVYLWTRVTGADDGTVVEHVWYYEDEEADRVSLDIGSPDWRTWSTKTIPPDWTGSWRVEVLGPDDTVLESVPFMIQ